jgi:hypothetical protein
LKKSHAVPIPLVSTLAVAALAAGCGSSQTQGWQTCVDRQSKVAVEQRYCDEEAPRYANRGYVPHYGWYYFPRGYYTSGPAIGTRVPDGGAWGGQPFVSKPMSRTGTVVRGGLGSTASGHSSVSS